MTLPTLNALSAEIVAAASRELGEPSWLTERRCEAWTFFAQAGPPEWRRTDLSGLRPEELAPTLNTSLTLTWDGDRPAQGVIVKPLRAALADHEDLIKTYMDAAVPPLEHKFSALRAALWQDGALVYVPKNAATETPIHVRYTLPSRSRTTFPRTLMVVEANAQVTLIEEFTADDQPATALAAPISEIFVGPGSQVRFISVQRWGDGVYHIGGQKAILERDASLEWTSISLGAQVQHIEAETTLKGDGSRVNWLGATFAGGTQRLLIAPWLRHVGHHAESYMEFRTVVNDKGYSIFDGMIKIERESTGTSTRLEEHALHLNPGARNDSIPGLKIDTNNVVKAGHASTSGDVDEEQLFYMQSRGISRTEAKRMIVMGFFGPAFDTIPVESLRAELEATIERKI